MVEPQPFSVLIVDDHAMVADALQIALADAGVHVLGAVGTLGDALDLMAQRPADVVVLDYSLPGGEQPADGIRRLLSEYPGSKVLVFSGRDDNQTVTDAVRAGCSGFVVKGRPLRELVEAVHAVSTGGAAFEPRHLRVAFEALSSSSHPAGYDLTSRELEVLRLLAKGSDTAKIAAELGISVNTVRNHIQAVLGKLGAHSQLEAVAMALRGGIIPPP